MIGYSVYPGALSAGSTGQEKGGTMSDQRGSAAAGGMLFIAIAIVISAFVGAGAIKDVKRAGDMISVTGSAKMRVVSDQVVWRGSLQGVAGTRAEAAKAVARHRDEVLGFLNDQGIPSTDIQVMPVYTHGQPEYDQHGRDTGRILRYTSNQDFVIRSNNVDRITEVAEAAQELMQRGVPFSSYQPEYTYSKLDEARVNLMSEATTDAMKRAEQIAGAAGGKIGAIRQARMGVIQVVAPNSTNISDYGMYDTSTVEKDVIAVVKVSFAVE